MRWELDPDLVLHTRLSFGRHAVLVAAIIAIGLGLAIAVSRAVWASAAAPATDRRSRSAR